MLYSWTTPRKTNELDELRLNASVNAYRFEPNFPNRNKVLLLEAVPRDVISVVQGEQDSIQASASSLLKVENRKKLWRIEVCACKGRTRHYQTTGIQASASSLLIAEKQEENFGYLEVCACKGPSMNFFIIPLTIIALVSCSFSSPDDNSRSSFLYTVEDHYLEGHVIHRKKASSVLSCAQLCMRRFPECRSLNYDKKEGTMVCELNDEGINIAETGVTSLVPMSGYIFAQLLNLMDQYNTKAETGNKEQTFVFSTLGARGETGPTITSGYVGTLLEGKVTLNNGIQIWTVPVTGSYVIEASGGSGANGTDISKVPVSWTTGGLGAQIEGTFKLVQGTQLKILVGQEGHRATSWGDQPGGGGGGSFVTLLNNTPLIIAGGGGGGSRVQYKDGDPGQATENGTRCGGKEGTGGQVCDAAGNVVFRTAAGGGAGLTGDGKGGAGIEQNPSSFINGGTGGTCPVSHGGFGGGGFAYILGGGGGGYSGGGVVGNSTSGVAGGGGSYNSGTDQQNMSGVNKGDGKVVIQLKT
ncbi:hypothetical protein ACROYT_G009434 [Oculina patagonica]